MLAPFSVNGSPGAALDCKTGTPGSARSLPVTMKILLGAIP
jgi:hypothetical protein